MTVRLGESYTTAIVNILGFETRFVCMIKNDLLYCISNRMG